MSAQPMAPSITQPATPATYRRDATHRAGPPATVELLAWQPLDTSRRIPIQEELPFEDPLRDRGATTTTTRDTFDRQPTGTADLPPAAQFAAAMTVAALEIAAGARPATQAMRHCSPRVFESLVRRQAHRAGRPAVRRPVAIRRVRICHVRDGVVEATVVVRDAHRVRPIAVRLEGLDGRWLVTALEFG